MKKENILVIDTGSSSMRGIVIDQDGLILMSKQFPNFMMVGDNGVAEQDSQSFQDCFIRICREINQECSYKNLGLSALCLTSQRSSVLPLDSNGQPLSNAYMWYDKRSLDICNKLSTDCQKEIYNICGMKPTPILSAPKMVWLKEQKPEIYHNATKLVGIHDYLLYLCTGRFVTDVTLASRTCLLDLQTKSWSAELLSLFGLDSNKLCELILPGETAGYITKSFSQLTGLTQGLPVISSGGDQQCSLLGQGITKEGSLGVTSGTGAYVTTLTPTPILDTTMRVSTTLSVLPNLYVLEASNMGAGSIYKWIRDTFYSEDPNYNKMNAQILLSPPGANGLIMLPDLAGKGCPHWDASARGSFHNIGFQHKSFDFARASLEGICAEIAECRAVLLELVPLQGMILSSGGLSRFFEYNQILSDMFGCVISICPIEETTAIGAWAVATSGLGFYPNAIEAMEARCENYLFFSEATQFSPKESNTKLYHKQAEVRTLLRTSNHSNMF